MRSLHLRRTPLEKTCEKQRSATSPGPASSYLIPCRRTPEPQGGNCCSVPTPIPLLLSLPIARFCDKTVGQLCKNCLQAHRLITSSNWKLPLYLLLRLRHPHPAPPRPSVILLKSQAPSSTAASPPSRSTRIQVRPAASANRGLSAVSMSGPKIHHLNWWA